MTERERLRNALQMALSTHPAFPWSDGELDAMLAAGIRGPEASQLDKDRERLVELEGKLRWSVTYEEWTELLAIAQRLNAALAATEKP